MSDDAAYASFLEKANADPNAGTGHKAASTSESRSKFDPTTSTADALPAALRSLPDVTYTSDTDSPFEPVVLNYSGGGLPSAHEFAKCLGSKTKAGPEGVEELSVEDFDPRGDYTEIIQRVRQAGKAGDGHVKIFRVEVSKTRAEYYVITVGDSKLIGVVAKAVES